MKLLGIDPPTIDRRLYVIHSFYKWAEEAHRTRWHTQVYAVSELPDEMRGYQFPITSQQATKSLNGVQVDTWAFSFPLGEGSQYPPRNTPTEDQRNESILIARTQYKYGVRNSLLILYPDSTGARTFEFLTLRTEDLPKTWAELLEIAEREDDFIEIELRRKTGWGRLRISADLLYATFEYILYDRPILVARLEKQGKKDPGFVFLSEMGGVLHKDSAGKIGRSINRAAGIRRAGLHRYRARFILEVVKTCLAAVEAEGNIVDMNSTWFETILILASQMMGHTHPMSLRPYLTGLLTVRVNQMEPVRAGQMWKRIKEREAILYAQEQRLRANSFLLEAGRLIESGRFDDGRQKVEEYIHMMKDAA
jgi:hypothetical protein